MKRAKLKNGDYVIYRKVKRSRVPGPRAQGVIPAPKGDDYTYHVNKLWRVMSVGDEEVLVRTVTGKQHSLALADPNLRRANWWDQWFYRDRLARFDEFEDTAVSGFSPTA